MYEWCIPKDSPPIRADKGCVWMGSSTGRPVVLGGPRLLPGDSAGLSDPSLPISALLIFTVTL
jgi:hypothetical protein